MVEAAPDLVVELTGFRAFGAPTLLQVADGVRYFSNEYWTARQRQAHSLHEVSYRACFKPQLPAFFIDRLTVPGDVVYDPFMGRGTTPVEAALRGRIPFGSDINPLSRALVEPRINPPALAEIEARLRQIPWAAFTRFERQELLVFYHPETLARIEGLRSWLRKRKQAGTLDQVDRFLRMVAINRLTGHSQGFFSVYTLPPNQALSIESQRRINARRRQTPEARDVPALLLRKARSLLSTGPARADRTLLLTARSDHIPEIADGAVALTVTSPPFLDIVDYEADNWLRCWFLGVEAKQVPITRHRSIERWQAFIHATLAELARVTRPGGHIAFEVGEVRNGRVQLEQQVIAAAHGLPLETLGVMVNRQDFTKTANCWGVANNRGGTNSNRIVLLRKG